jgi:hypothetical protein
MFVKAYKNVERFHPFLNEELDDIALLDFHRLVAFSNGAKESPLTLSLNMFEFCCYISK